LFIVILKKLGRFQGFLSDWKFTKYLSGGPVFEARRLIITTTDRIAAGPRPALSAGCRLVLKKSRIFRQLVRMTRQHTDACGA